MKYWLTTVVAACLIISGCSLLPDRSGPNVNIVQSSDYCGTKTPDAAVHYFASPDPLANWIAERDIRELRAAAASLTGVLVVELGQRPSAGYSLEVIDGASRIEGDTLYMAMRWNSPELDAHVSQQLLSPCMIIPRPKGEYKQVVLVDQRGEQRGQVAVP